MIQQFGGVEIGSHPQRTFGKHLAKGEMSHTFRGGYSFFRVLFKHFLQKILGFFRNIEAAISNQFVINLTFSVFVNNFFIGGALERNFSRKQHVENYSSRKNVSLAVIGIVVQYLRGDIAWGPTAREKLIIIFFISRESEVHYSDVNFFGILQNDVLRLQVPMNNFVSVQIIEPLYDLKNDGERFYLCLVSLRYYALKEVLAVV